MKTVWKVMTCSRNVWVDVWDLLKLPFACHRWYVSTRRILSIKQSHFACGKAYRRKNVCREKHRGVSEEESPRKESVISSEVKQNEFNVAYQHAFCLRVHIALHCNINLALWKTLLLLQSCHGNNLESPSVCFQQQVAFWPKKKITTQLPDKSVLYHLLISLLFSQLEFVHISAAEVIM